MVIMLSIEIDNPFCCWDFSPKKYETDVLDAQ